MLNSIQAKAADSFVAFHGYSAAVCKLRNTSSVSIDYRVGGTVAALAAGASAVIDSTASTSEVEVRRSDLSATPVSVMLDFGVTSDEAYELASAATLAHATEPAAHGGSLPISIVDFGAIGGGADDTTAILAAVAAAKANGGKRTVFIPDGTWETDEITVDFSGVDFVGTNNKSSILKSRSGQSIIRLTGSLENVNFFDIGFQGHASVGTGHGIYNDGSLSFLHQCVISGCAFRELRGHGLYLPSLNAFSYTVRDCIASGCLKDQFRVGGGVGVLFDGCSVYNVPADSAGFRVLLQATLRGCNGVWSGDGVWARFGGTGDAESDSMTAFPFVHVTDCNVENFNTIGLDVKQAAAILILENTSFVSRSGVSNQVAIQTSGMQMANPATFAGLTFRLGSASSWKNTVPVHGNPSTSGVSLDGSVDTIYSDGNSLAYPSFSLRRSPVPNSNNYGFTVNPIGPVHLVDVLGMTVGNRNNESASAWTFRTTIPSSGTFTAGAKVFIPGAKAVAGSVGSQYILIGWHRLTTGSAHVLNTDWVELRCMTGT